MKISWVPTFLLLSSGVSSLSIPNLYDLVARHADPTPETSDLIDLEKRRGGGGGHSSGGGFSGGSSGGRTGSSSGSSSGSRGGSSRGGSSSGSTSSSSNVGGSTSRGSGVQPQYGGGSFYAGGASTPYRSGSRSGSISPHLVAGAGLGFLGAAFLLHANSYYLYPYPHHYLYNDHEYLVECVCAQYSECGCGDNQNQTYYTSLFHGERPENSTNVRVVDVNGTETIYINGTLPNGTTATNGASPAGTVPAHLGGYLVTVAVVAAAVWGI